VEDVSAYYRSLYSKGKFEQSRAIQDLCGLEKVNTPQNFQEGSQLGFFSYQEIIDNFAAMRAQFPQLISNLTPISDTLLTIENRPINWIRISDNPDLDEQNEPEVLMSSLHHAREPLSVSQLIFFAWYLLENYNSNAEIKQIVDQVELYIVPCVNPDGYVYNETSSPGGGGLWRKNRRNNGDGNFGVDLNRNYGMLWGYDDIGSSPNTNAQTYRGTNPFSEPETRLMKMFTEEHQFIYAINNHSFSNVLIYPYGYLDNSQCPDSSIYRNLSESMCLDNHFYYGTVPEAIYYTGNGSSDDWMYGDTINKSKVFAFTPEFGEPYYGFWPAAETIIPSSANEVLMNLKTLKLLLPYAEVINDAPYYFQNEINGSLPIRFVSLGNASGTFIVEGIGIKNISFTDFSPVIIESPIRFDTLNYSVSYAIPSNLMPGDTIQYVWLIGIDGNFWRDTVTHIYGQALFLLNDSIVNIDNWVSEGITQAWGTTGERYHSSPFSITDSPSSLYAANEESYVEFSQEINLTDYIDARLDFWLWWYTERYYDIASIQIKTENGVWENICGNYTATYDNFQGIDPNPNYSDRTRLWRKECISLKQFIGNKIKIRFQFKSDEFSELDGIYLDDIQLYGIKESTNGLASLDRYEFSLYPNPNSGYLKIIGPTTNFRVEIYEISGKLMQTIQCNSGFETVNTESLANGLYWIQLTDSNGNSENQKFIVQH
jgi:hypothetical protein